MSNNPKIIQLEKFLNQRKSPIGFREVRFLFDFIDDEKEVNEQARKIYRKWYQARYKKKRRQSHPSCVTFFPEFENLSVEQAAEKYKMEKPEFVRKATLAFINQKYILTNEETVASIEQQLARLASEFAFHAELYPGAIGNYLSTLQKRFVELEEQFSKIIRQPKKLETQIYTPTSIRQGVLIT